MFFLCRQVPLACICVQKLVHVLLSCAGVFVSTRKFEAEIVSMVCSMLNGHPIGAVGTLTSGGSESILMAVKTYRWPLRSHCRCQCPSRFTGTSSRCFPFSSISQIRTPSCCFLFTMHQQGLTFTLCSGYHCDVLLLFTYRIRRYSGTGLRQPRVSLHPRSSQPTPHTLHWTRRATTWAFVW